jgi:flagellin
MASIINTNIASLNAQRNLNTSQSALATSLQRLSSGLRINSAKDDAAGMAIATRMTSQINGLNQATRNANDGISLAQTAEGAMAAVTDNLQRMRELAVQSANATNSSTDRASLNAEVQQLMSEINRVAQVTSFNGVNLLDGSFTAQAFQVGANAGGNNQVKIDAIGDLRTSTLGLGGSGGASLSSGLTTVKLAAGDLTLSGVPVGASDSVTVLANAQAGQTSDSAWAIARAINEVSTQSGVTATANTTYVAATSVTGVAATAAKAVSAGSFSINGIAVGAIEAGSQPTSTVGSVTAVVAQGANVGAAINKISYQTGVVATVDATGAVKLSSTDGKSIAITVNGTYTGASLTSDTGLTAATTSATGVPAASGAITANTDLIINGVGIAAAGGANIAAGGTIAGQGANVAAAINLSTAQTGVTAAVDATTGAITLAAKDGRNIVVAGAGLANTGLTAGTYRGTYTLNSTNPAGVVVGGTAAGTAKAGLGDYTGQSVTANTAAGSILGSIDVLTSSSATSALSVIDSALTSVNSFRATMGAVQNRFSSVVSNLQATAENVTAARSRIQDTDFAAETAQLTRAQILQQAGTAMLAQANQLPSGVLALLK